MAKDQYKTGSIADESGMFKCTSCGEEINVQEGHRIPPCPRDANSEWTLSGSSSGRSSSRGRGRSQD